MVLKVLSSGSAGNCYILEASGGGKLIIECGIPMREIKQALNFNLHGVAGCLVSHRHQDHSKALQDILKCGIRVLSTEDVFTSQNVKNRAFCKSVEPMHGYAIGGYKVFVLPVVHDVPCVGFIIEHMEMGRLLFITDTMMLEYRLPQLNHIMIEANYSDDILQENIGRGIVPSAVRERLLRSHMELQTCKDVLAQNDLSGVNEIILLHLSGNNSDPTEFTRQVCESTGKPVYVAKRGLTLDISKDPY